ncbi:hypothetical protein C0991_003788 [Blastosporella zonata]|nr:hypothetical protein C0991_003788 [Blastosporella zonata]
MSQTKSSSSSPSISKFQNEGPVPESTEDATPQNWWWSYKQMLREPVAEFAGVMLLTIFGLGVNCQAVLSSNPAVSASPKGVRRQRQHTFLAAKTD